MLHQRSSLIYLNYKGNIWCQIYTIAEKVLEHMLLQPEALKQEILLILNTEPNVTNDLHKYIIIFCVCHQISYQTVNYCGRTKNRLR